ncbi:hypothetical protein QCA50_003366 [Cerrena zonata]|uniref:Uncharacterized protein n=1 Tax=Cerrena zonata TaxID=2478898 RepID=A0AAW0GPP5_9APHY
MIPDHITNVRSAQGIFSLLSTRKIAKNLGVDETGPTCPQSRNQYLREELGSTTFISPSILGKICPHPNQDLLGTIHAALRTMGWESSIGSLNPTKWSPSTAESGYHYQKISEVLDTIKRAIRNINSNSDSFYEDPYLTIYDLCMPVKLDVDLSLEPLLQHLLYEDRQWWNQCVLPLEVEAEMTICIARSCFYARSALAVQPYRSFFPIVTLDPETLDVCYTFHHRTGTIVSELLSLQTPQGWTRFVEAACGIFNWSFKGAGMDTSRSCNYMFLELDQAGASANHFVVLKLDLILDRRTNPQGRSTLVEKFSLFSSARDANAAIAPALSSNDAMFTTFLHSSLRRIALEASIARPEPEKRKPRTDPGSFTAKEYSTQPKIARYPKDTNEYYILNNSRFLVLQGIAPPSDMTPFEIPQTLVCKDVWTHSLAHCDGAILAPLRGEFGIPDVWGYVYVEENQLLAETLDLRR